MIKIIKREMIPNFAFRKLGTHRVISPLRKGAL